MIMSTKLSKGTEKAMEWKYTNGHLYFPCFSVIYCLKHLEIYVVPGTCTFKVLIILSGRDKFSYHGNQFL